MRFKNAVLICLAIVILFSMAILVVFSKNENNTVRRTASKSVKGLQSREYVYHNNYVASELIELNDNGAWSWFISPRVIVNDDKLIVGSVRSERSNPASLVDLKRGNVEISVYDIKTGRVDHAVLHPNFEADDHDVPSLLLRNDGSYLAAYSKHRIERRVYYRISKPHNPLIWSKAHIVETPNIKLPTAIKGNNVTYTNLLRMPSGRIYNFIRAFQGDPNYMYSDDDGITWTYGGRWLYGKGGYSPYLQYVHDGLGAIHFIVTEDHPRNFNNSLYHGYLKDNILYQSDGTKVGTLSTSIDSKIATWDFTKVFQGDTDHVAWMTDFKLDRNHKPFLLFSTQRDGNGKPRYQGGLDLRYHYAFWDGKTWHSEEIAYAGSRLYVGEDDYSGLATFDPKNLNIVYISTNVDPVKGTPLISAADNKQHYELFRGERSPRETWTWTPFTRNSTTDNLRPIIPDWDDSRTAIIWMRGKYANNHGKWYTAVVAAITN